MNAHEANIEGCSSKVEIQETNENRNTGLPNERTLEGGPSTTVDNLTALNSFDTLPLAESTVPSLNSTNISSECMHSSIIQSFPDLLDNSLTSPHPCSSIENENFDIGEIFELRTKNLNNPFIGFLNINSLRNKITDLRLIMERCLPDILVIEETKLNSDFKTETFLINNYQKPIRRDRNEFGGGLMQFVRKGVLCNRVLTFEGPSIELICSELTVCKKKWIIFSIYRPPDAANLELFFRELSFSLNSALDKYDNVMIMGDIKIDTHDIQHPGYTKLISFCDVFGLSNLVKDKTCFTKNHSSSIDVMLTNKPKCFQNTSVFETGLSDFHGLVSTFMKIHIPRLKPKIVKYRSYKKFDSDKFLQDVKNTDFTTDRNDADLSYRNLSSSFRKLVDKHAPLKTKVQRGNTAPFMNQQLQKAIYTRSRLKKDLIKTLPQKTDVSSKSSVTNVFL